MKTKEFLEKRLTADEANELLNELTGYTCNDEYLVRYCQLRVFDEEGNQINTIQMVGHKDLHIVKNILFLKEKIDEERGERVGRNELQKSIKQVLGIK